MGLNVHAERIGYAPRQRAQNSLESEHFGVYQQLLIDDYQSRFPVPTPSMIAKPRAEAEGVEARS